PQDRELIVGRGEERPGRLRGADLGPGDDPHHRAYALPRRPVAQAVLLRILLGGAPEPHPGLDLRRLAARERLLLACPRDLQAQRPEAREHIAETPRAQLPRHLLA